MNAVEQLHEIEGQLAYVKDVLKRKDNEAWEIKEYNELLLQYQKEIKELKNHIKNNKHLFV